MLCSLIESLILWPISDVSSLDYTHSPRANFLNTCSKREAISQETLPLADCSAATHFLAFTDGRVARPPRQSQFDIRVAHE
jgi:hypothetical protein